MCFILLPIRNADSKNPPGIVIPAAGLFLKLQRILTFYNLPDTV